jgi:hypothetical protein
MRTLRREYLLREANVTTTVLSGDARRVSRS